MTYSMLAEKHQIFDQHKSHLGNLNIGPGVKTAL